MSIYDPSYLSRLTDNDFIDIFGEDEITYELMVELDFRRQRSDFRLAYDVALSKKYDQPLLHILIGYVPLFVFCFLIFFGIYLTCK